MRKIFVLTLFASLLLTGCFAPFGLMSRSGTAWGVGAFRSNGQRIYFTGTNDQGERIGYRGGPWAGAMMMGGLLSCASCHGPDATGGVHMMHMQVMDAPDIRWKTLAQHSDDHEEEGEEEHTGYDLETFRLAVVEGRHPDGEPLDPEMPRWKMDNDDLADLVEYLQSLS